MAKWILTQRAYTALNTLAFHSRMRWGERQTSIYLDKINKRLFEIAENPSRHTAKHLSASPFILARCESHYVLYDTFEGGIIVANFYHPSQDIESRIAKLKQELLLEIERLKP